MIKRAWESRIHSRSPQTARSCPGSISAGILASGFSRHAPNESHLFFTVRFSRRVEDVMKPDRRRFHDVRMLPRFPWIKSLRLASDESPVDRAHVMGFGDGQNSVEGAADGARHVLSTDDGAIVTLEPAHVLLEALGPAVVVERDHVRKIKLHALHGGEFFRS